MREVGLQIEDLKNLRSRKLEVWETIKDILY